MITILNILYFPIGVNSKSDHPIFAQCNLTYLTPIDVELGSDVVSAITLHSGTSEIISTCSQPAPNIDSLSSSHSLSLGSQQETEQQLHPLS